MKTFNEWLLENHPWDRSRSESDPNNFGMSPQAEDESEWPEDERESESERNEKLMVVDLVKRLLKADREGPRNTWADDKSGMALDKAIQKAANKLDMDKDDVENMWWDVAGPNPFSKSWHDIHPDHRRDKDLSYSDPATPTFAKDDFEKLQSLEIGDDGP